MPSTAVPRASAPFTLRQGLFAATVTGVAGFVDGLAFIHLGGYFVSFMSGNSTRAGADLAEGIVEGWAKAMGLVLFFVLGVMLSAWALQRRRRRLGRTEDGPQFFAVGITLTLLTLATALSLVAELGAPAPAAVAGFVIPPLLAASMGAVNGTFTRGGEVTVGLTYMTGTLVKVGQHLVTGLMGGSRTVWLYYLFLWAAIAFGSVLGAVGYLWAGLPALVVPVTVLAVVLLLSRRVSFV